MVYIKGLKFRGFKSFRKAEASFPKGYVCLAGPNGSGKSNVTDGIRFALGEASLKALRAKKVAELVNTSCKFAEVTLYIDGERQYEIKRIINSEGKTGYKINGKHSTRTLVMEELRQYGLEAGSHNIIAQGQVQKIVEMNAKERRQIIDSVSGIAEYDAKKAEALSELSQVDQKINDAKIVLAEREGMLLELEKEKDSAIAYTDSQTNFKRAKSSLANAEYTKLNKQFEDIVKKHTAATAAIEEIRKQEIVLGSRVSNLSGQKDAVLEKFNSSGNREAAMREIEEIKVSISSDEATLLGQKKESERLEAEEKGAKAKLAAFRKSQEAIAAEMAKLGTQLKAAQSQISDFEKKKGIKSGSQHEEVALQLETLNSKIMSLKERKATSEAALAGLIVMLEAKRQEKERLADTMGAAGTDKLDGEMSVLAKEIAGFQSSLDKLFERERELNRAMPELEKRMLSLKEKATILRSSIAPSASSMALRAVEEMREGGMKGIFGPVSSLLTCDAKYTAAIEAAAGQRLNYVVVDCMDTAVKAIEKLKSQKSGRCTFIPLDTTRASNEAKSTKAAGCLGTLVEFVDFEPAYRTALNYVFSDTLLFDTVQNAKKAGIGTARMVTLGGELIERSGIISGGAQKGSVLSQSSLTKLEAEVEAAKKERDSLLSQLYEIRDEMSKKRKEKADVEVRLRGFEIEQKSAEEKRDATKKTRAALEEIASQAASLEKKIAETKAEINDISADLVTAVSQHVLAKQSLAKAEEAARAADSESSQKLAGLHAARSGLEAQLEAKKSELAKLVSDQDEKESDAKSLVGLMKDCKKSVESLILRITDNKRLQEEKERRFSEMSAASKKLYSQIQELEAQIADVASQHGKIKQELEKKEREQFQLETNRGVIEQKLSDIKVELEQYAGVPTIDATRAELEELVKSSQLKMDSLGSVNLRAPELYEQKKKDIEDVKSRVGSLEGEKNAVMRMMDEIDTRKREIFLTTFTAVNDNFKKLFSYSFKGDGTMVLEQPTNPFEGGLNVRVREANHDKYLESMSGGEKSLLALMFIFSIQMYKAAPFYILDEADAALDKENSRKLSELIRQMSSNTQFIVVTHNDTVLSNADVALGVTRTEDGSKIVGVQLTSVASVAKAKQKAD